jgi:hypothetical protein
VNQEHYDTIKEGVDVWNAWRKDNSKVIPDLRKANLNIAVLDGADLRKAKLQKAILWGAGLKGANLRGAILHKTDLEDADLRDAKLKGIKYRKLGRCRGILLKGCSGSPMFIRDAKDKEYIEEFAERHKLLYLAWSLSSDCGRSVFRWLFWSLMLALFFGFNFLMLEQGDFKIDWNLPVALVSALYYSIVNFTTLGFAYITPQTHTGAIWVVAEVITGYVMLGGLIAILASKLTRRAS